MLRIPVLQRYGAQEFGIRTAWSWAVVNTSFLYFLIFRWGETMSLNCDLQRIYCSSPDDNEYGALVKWYWQGKTEELGEKCPSATLSTTNPTWIDMDANPGFRGERPAIKCLCHGTEINTSLHLVQVGPIWRKYVSSSKINICTGGFCNRL
jgi:hypothetical protein